MQVAGSRASKLGSVAPRPSIMVDDSAVSCNAVMQPGDNIVLDVNGQKLSLVRLRHEGSIKVGGQSCSMAPLIGAQFGAAFQLSQDGQLVPAACNPHDDIATAIDTDKVCPCFCISFKTRHRIGCCCHAAIIDCAAANAAHGAGVKAVGYACLAALSIHEVDLTGLTLTRRNRSSAVTTRRCVDQ